MGPGWAAVTLIAIFVIVFVLLNLVEKGSID